MHKITPVIFIVIKVEYTLFAQNKTTTRTAAAAATTTAILKYY